MFGAITITSFLCASIPILHQLEFVRVKSVPKKKVLFFSSVYSWLKKGIFILISIQYMEFVQILFVLGDKKTQQAPQGLCASFPDYWPIVPHARMSCIVHKQKKNQCKVVAICS